MSTSTKIDNSINTHEILFKALCNYLPYGVKIKDNHGWQIMEGLDDTCVNPTYENPAYFDEVCKPILLPLSDLTDRFLMDLFNDYDLDIIRTKHRITINYRMMGDWLKEHISLITYNNERCLTMSAWLCVALIKKHVDLFGLIKKGLAVDKNKI